MNETTERELREEMGADDGNTHEPMHEPPRCPICGSYMRVHSLKMDGLCENCGYIPD